MNRFALALLSSLLLGASVTAYAGETLQTSRSAGKLQRDQATDLSQTLKQSAPVSRAATGEAENYSAGPSQQSLAGVANRYDQVFEIVAGDVGLISDLDGDGFHHALKVSFDVDVSYDSATVYAKLYLSREGEPWSQYFTSDLFAIHQDDYSDAYEVETELIEGYPPGYYAVLVEIYSFDHAYMVASAIFDYHSLGRDLMIEDLAGDEPYVEERYEEFSTEYYEEEVYHSSGGGSFGPLLIFYLLTRFVIAARGSLAAFPLSPRNDGDYNNYKKTP